MNLFCNITKWGIAMAACAAMAACGSDEPSPTGGEEKGELRLLVSVPDRATRAIGDPGDEPQEADMWDRVSVIATFPGGQEVEREVYIKSFDRADYEQLPPYNGNEKIRVVTMDVSEGDAYIYGVTYNTAVDGNNLEKAIQACTTDAEVRALTIGNDYADGMQYSLPLKLSVATGYYKDADGKQATFNTRKGASTGLPEGELPVVRLTRLASKFDVQWDAADAYAQGYTDVEVTGFEFEGWFLDPDIWEEPFDGKNFADKPITAEVNVYAKYEKTQPTAYLVEFDTDGGSAVSSMTVSVIETSPYTEKSGYQFVGWYKDADRT